ncbi:MAG: iron hydrogenase small subunit [Candidatus Aenigmarchaeota archaeon]|nr:iron hydrogenase small subunit [Candidatus Aenigmarchaeota archaeon]
MQVKIDGKRVFAKDGETILEVAKRIGISIPTLCYHPDLKPEGRCRICIVEADGKLVTSCNTPVREGMEVLTHTKRVTDARKLNAELLHGNAHSDNDVEITKVFRELGIEKTMFGSSSISSCKRAVPLEREGRLCVLCGRCAQVCSRIQGIENIDVVNRSVCSSITTPYNTPMLESPCTFCGQCALYCPTTALRERALSEKLVRTIDEMALDISHKKKFYVVQTAPAVRASLGEMFGMAPGTLVKGKMVSALKKIGFDKVFDTNFAADLTIMEEANEFLERYKKKKNLPLITSCCPSWIVFAEQNYPHLFKHISSCKSPQQMFGAVAKNYYAKLLGKDAKGIFVASIMPCVAKKLEAARPEMRTTGSPDVDLVLTTRELGRVIKSKGIEFSKLPDGDYDTPLGSSSGGAALFGVTGGVMEAALRVAYEELTGKSLNKLDFTSVRGLDGIREAEISIAGERIKVAIVHTLGNIRKFFDGGQWKKYHFIEVMACPGGCIGGGGQPRPTTNEIRLKRMEALYKEDKGLSIRISSHNPDIQTLYKDFLGKPLSKKAEKLLHTKYHKRKPRYF